MSGRDALIIVLPQKADVEPEWMRVIDQTVVQRGKGADWLSACGLRELPTNSVSMLVAPAAATTLHWVEMPDLPARQGRAAARLGALDTSIGQADTMAAATDEQNDPAKPHLVAVTARADLQHWLLWSQHNGIDPEVIIPAALLLPDPLESFARGTVGDTTLLRGNGIIVAEDDPIASVLVADAVVQDLPADAVTTAMIGALEHPAINLRQGDFAKRTRMTVDRDQVARIVMWSGFVALVSLLIALIAIIKLNVDADRLDAESLAIARKVAPNAVDAIDAATQVDQQLIKRGTGAYGFSGPTAGLYAAMRGSPSVGLTLLDRSQDGTLKATLAAPKADDINVVLLALQASGFTITATSSQDPSGRVLANITVRP